MAQLTVRTIGDPVLRQLARTVSIAKISNPEFQQFLDDLVETMRAEDGVGLAAPQVGESVRAIAIEYHDNPRYPDIPDIPLEVWINPEIVEQSEKTCSFQEGCLSVKEQRGDVWRPEWVKVVACDRRGHVHEFVAEGIRARILQHELDHLNGILFVDRLTESESAASSTTA